MGFLRRLFGYDPENDNIERDYDGVANTDEFLDIEPAQVENSPFIYKLELAEHPLNASHNRWSWALERRRRTERFSSHHVAEGWAGTEEQAEAKAKLAKERDLLKLNAKHVKKEI